MTSAFSIVGGVTGPLSALSPEARRFVDSGQAYDFAVGGLPFRLASTDETPYGRETAQYRKDQFDASNTPGDQSLAGWWLRSQFSFHKGAGVKYYEALDGEAILNRFSSSSQVDATELGAVTLQPEFTTTTTLGGGDYFYEAATCSLVPDLVAYTTGSGTTKSFKRGAGAAVTYTLSAGTDTHIAGGPANIYVATTGSKIERFATNTTDAITPNGPIYTCPNRIDGVWVAKGRLWVVDSAGNFYAATCAPTGALPVALPTATVSFPAATTTSDASIRSSLAEAPAGVYVSRGDGHIYYVTIASDGTIPTMAAPVVMAEMPKGEKVRCIRYYLGYLVIQTNLGVRVAAAAADGGLTVGPLLIKFSGDSGSRSIGATGSRVSVIGFATGAVMTAYEINLSQPIAGSALEFAWQEIGPVDNSSSAHGWCGITELNGSGLTYWAGNKLKANLDGPVATSGSLTTGFHRFGTLEPKQFHSVRVRVGGISGTVTVSRVMKDGSTVSLLTIDVSQSNVEDIALGLASPEEMLGLKFTLARGAGTIGPTLLGYQLRALPAPKRQRMLKVPLLIQDSVQNRAGVDRGRPGRAWEDLRALEALESEVALTTFTDYRTGESGLAYIESIAFQSNTPVTRNDGGFGGIAYLTLRVVA